MVAGRGGQPTQRWAAPTQRDRAAAQRFAQLTGLVARGVHESDELRRATALWRAALPLPDGGGARPGHRALPAPRYVQTRHDGSRGGCQALMYQGTLMRTIRSLPFNRMNHFRISARLL